MSATAGSSPFYSTEHAAFRDAMRRFVAREITPHVETWEAQGSFPVALYRQAAEICLLKNQATQTMAHCASDAVQMYGGAGFIRGVKVERIYREVKVNAIGGGAEEVMRDLAARQLGFH